MIELHYDIYGYIFLWLLDRPGVQSQDLTCNITKLTHQ